MPGRLLPGWLGLLREDAVQGLRAAPPSSSGTDNTHINECGKVTAAINKAPFHPLKKSYNSSFKTKGKKPKKGGDEKLEFCT